jgi:hydrogenase expression/formation protein HypE
MHQLIREYFAPEFAMKQFGDSAVITRAEAASRLAFTTDSYVVSPLFFPGGNIGDLAVNGTINDISMVGAEPLCLSAGFIIEEGFLLHDLRKILSSMAEAARLAHVRIVAGDTKVVEKGKGDGVFINTSGIGIIADGIDLGSHRIRAGDKVILSGSVGNHGIAVMAERNGLSFEPPVVSDTAALNTLVSLMLSVTREIHMMRDPTRGGVATTLKEIANESQHSIVIHEDLIAVRGGVMGACELLGLDPLYVANEGILVAIVSADAAMPLVAAMKSNPAASETVVIGEVIDNDHRTRNMVLLKTSIGGTRIVDMLSGEQLPRIC